MKNNRKLMVRIRVRVWFILFYYELGSTDPWCNTLQTLLGRKIYEEEMSDGQALFRVKFNKVIYKLLFL